MNDLMSFFHISCNMHILQFVSNAMIRCTDKC